MGWETQDDNKDTNVQVSSSSAKNGEHSTNFVITDKSTGDRTHISVDTGGNVTEHRSK